MEHALLTEAAEFDHLAAYQMMTLIRVLEERLLSLYAEGELSGTTHTSIGQEACAVGVLSAIDRDRDVVFSNHRCHGHYLAYGGPLSGLVAEIFGRRSGVCGGRGGSQHLCYRQFFSNGVQGGIVPQASGAALAQAALGTGGIVCVFLGDGTLGEGVVYETMNMAALWSLPIVFVIEDNGVAQSTPKEVAVSGDIAARPRAFDIPTVTLDATDVKTIHAEAATVMAKARSGSGPQCLVLTTLRLGPHSKGDDLRTSEEMMVARRRDPLRLLDQFLPPTEVLSAYTSARAAVDCAVNAAVAAPEAEVDFRTLLPLKVNRYRTPEVVEGTRVVERLNAGLRAALEQDGRVLILGEDIVDPYGGAFKVTKGLSSQFPERVRATPISEAAITGHAIGSAMCGLKPVVEIMFGDFCTLIVDQLTNHASKMRWMYNEQVEVPILIRAPMGGRRGYGPTHSQSLERFFFGLPGLRVVAVSEYWDPADTLLSCLSQSDPILLVENKVSYARPLADPPEGWERHSPATPLGPVHIAPMDRKPEVTIVAYGGTVSPAMEALNLLAEEEVLGEVIIPQQLSPLDNLSPLLLPQIEASRKLIVCEEGSGSWGFGSEVLASVSEAMPTRSHRMLRVAAKDCPIPSSRKLEDLVLPSARDIVSAASALFEME